MTSQSSGTINPFDDDSHRFTVLVNARGEHSLWPEFAAEPMGWMRVHGPDSRDACMRWVDTHWTAMQNASASR